MGTRLNFPLRVELELCSADTHLEPDQVLIVQSSPETLGQCILLPNTAKHMEVNLPSFGMLVILEEKNKRHQPAVSRG